MGQRETAIASLVIEDGLLGRTLGFDAVAKMQKLGRLPSLEVLIGDDAGSTLGSALLTMPFGRIDVEISGRYRAKIREAALTYAFSKTETAIADALRGGRQRLAPSEFADLLKLQERLRPHVRRVRRPRSDRRREREAYFYWKRHGTVGARLNERQIDQLWVDHTRSWEQRLNEQREQWSERIARSIADAARVVPEGRAVEAIWSIVRSAAKQLGSPLGRGAAPQHLRELIERLAVYALRCELQSEIWATEPQVLLAFVEWTDESRREEPLGPSQIWKILNERLEVEPLKTYGVTPE